MDDAVLHSTYYYYDLPLFIGFYFMLSLSLSEVSDQCDAFSFNSYYLVVQKSVFCDVNWSCVTNKQYRLIVTVLGRNH